MEVVPTDVTHDLFSGSTGIHVNVDASKRDVGPPSNRFDIFGQVYLCTSFHIMLTINLTSPHKETYRSLHILSCLS